ncbi:MAG: HAMP domain-containing sensor histidine kinase [Vicinamibacterales bacterium]
MHARLVDLEPARPGLREQQLRSTVPALRLLGFLALTLLVVLHKHFVDPTLLWTHVLLFGGLSTAYSLASWAVLHRIRPFGRLVFLSQRVAEADVGLWVGAMALTGGSDSWLFPLLIMRAADHVTFGLRRVLALGHYSAAAFFALIWWTNNGDISHASAAEWGKLGGVYIFNMYLALSASAIDRLNDRLRRMRVALQSAKDSAVAASGAKSAFLATMSHELRTPLSSIIGYAELLEEELHDQPEHASDLAKIRGAGKHLLALVNDVLDLAKVEAGKMEFVLTEFDIVAVARDLAAIARPLAESRRNTIAIDAPSVLWMRADEGRVRQVLLNLLSNACKFTEHGTVTMRLYAESGRDAASLIYMEIADTGIGMTPEQLSRAFEAFVQVDTSPTRRYGGTGLGLALTRELCALMGGNIQAESRPRHGSRFTVALPTAIGDSIQARVA